MCRVTLHISGSIRHGPQKNRDATVSDNRSLVQQELFNLENIFYGLVHTILCKTNVLCYIQIRHFCAIQVVEQMGQVGSFVLRMFQMYSTITSLIQPLKYTSLCYIH